MNNQIQKATFPDGGFVLHKLPFSKHNQISAWFDKEGEVKSAEFMPSGRAVKVGGSAWETAQIAGRISVGKIK